MSTKLEPLPRRNPFFTYRAQERRVIDGDTLDLKLDLGFGTHKNIRARLVGIDTAEIHGVEDESDEYARGMEHAKFVMKWITDARQQTRSNWPLIVCTIRDDKGKYGRYLAEVFRRDSGEALVDELKQEFDDVAR